MTTNLTLITSIVLTAAMTSAGTCYLVTKGQAGDNTISEAATQPSQSPAHPATETVNQQPNKPTDITIKTEVVEKHSSGRHPNYTAEWKALQSRPQPHLEVTKNTPTGK